MRGNLFAKSSKKVLSGPPCSTEKWSRRKMDWTSYHDLDVIYDYLHWTEQAHPEVARVYEIGRTFEGRPMKVLGLHLGGKDRKKKGGKKEWPKYEVLLYLNNIGQVLQYVQYMQEPQQWLCH